MSHHEIAIVHDYLTQRGGAERVVLSMLRMFPDAPLYTAVYEPDATFPEFAEYDVRPLWTNRVGSLHRNHRRGLLLYPFAFSGLRVDADLVLCSSSGFAHGVKTHGRKVVYCYTPARWLYEEAPTYLAGWSTPVAACLRAFAPGLRRWDKRAAATADAYLTTTVAVKARILDTYSIEATVVHPSAPAFPDPVGRSVPGIDPGFVLCVSRLLTYKNVEAVTAAFKSLPDARLVVVGDGPEKARLNEISGPNVSILGRVDDPELAWLYANSVGLVAAGHEDYGLTPLEAAVWGKPVAALRAGGYLDTVVEDTTGVFFDSPDPTSIASAVRHLLTTSWELGSIAHHVERFTEVSFARRLSAAVRTLEDPNGFRNFAGQEVAA